MEERGNCYMDIVYEKKSIFNSKGTKLIKRVYNLPYCPQVILFFVTVWTNNSSANVQKYKTAEQGDPG